MARPITTETELSEENGKAGAGWITQGTARAFAAAVSALLIATAVVNRSHNGLTVEGTSAASEVTVGTISLVDDDQGHSLFDLSAMVPGRPTVQCISVTYDGTITPVDLTLVADADGDLPEYLDVTVDEGTGGGFGDCDQFTAERGLFTGTLAELVDGDSLALGTILNTGEKRVFRVTFEVQDRREALGRSASLGFVWEARPS